MEKAFGDAYDGKIHDHQNIATILSLPDGRLYRGARTRRGRPYGPVEVCRIMATSAGITYDSQSLRTYRVVSHAIERTESISILSSFPFLSKILLREEAAFCV